MMLFDASSYKCTKRKSVGRTKPLTTSGEKIVLISLGDLTVLFLNLYDFPAHSYSVLLLLLY